jgi:hypothetical protein
MSEAGVMFDNSFLDNSFDLVEQWKNGSFLGIFSVHKKLKLALVELNLRLNFVGLMFCSTFFLNDTGQTKH